MPPRRASNCTYSAARPIHASSAQRRNTFPPGPTTLKDFEYAAASTVDEAVSLLAARGPKAKILAGGTDILVQLREGMREADLVLDVKKIPELTQYSFSPETGLHLGAATPCYRIYGDEKIVKAYPALADSARIIGGWQIQSRASIGGNLCNSSPAGDSLPALINLGALYQEQSRHDQALACFGRVIELVSQDGADRQAGRMRWKHYSDRGYTITRHDVALEAHS